MRPDQSQSRPRRGIRGLRRRSAAVTALLVLGLPVFAGCALLEGPTPATPEREAPQVPEVKPEFVPDGSAKDNLPYFTEVLREFSEDSARVQGEAVVNAVADAGFKVKNMQVSFDRTKTDLEADNIFVSVKIGKNCLIGQMVTGDRSFVAQVEPAVGPDKNLCLIGETRAIDWR